jgi:hypothetical protein
VLNALTTWAPAAATLAVSSAAELPAGVTSSVPVRSKGFEMSTMTLPLSASP